MKRPTRVVVYIKDIEMITGRKPTSARDLYLAIKKYWNKRKEQCLTVLEFCEYMGIKEETVRDQFRL